MRKIKVFGKLTINGKDIPLVDSPNEQVTVQEFIISLVNHIQTSQMTVSDFSSLEFKLSKRVIQSNEPADEFMRMIQSNYHMVEEVNEADTLIGYPNITWHEYFELLDDPIFANMLRYVKTWKTSGNYTEQEAYAITEAYNASYAGSKFHKIIADLL